MKNKDYTNINFENKKIQNYYVTYTINNNYNIDNSTLIKFLFLLQKKFKF